MNLVVKVDVVVVVVACIEIDFECDESDESNSNYYDRWVSIQSIFVCVCVCSSQQANDRECRQQPEYLANKLANLQSRFSHNNR